MLFPRRNCPVAIETESLPAAFLQPFLNGECTGECSECGHCDRIADLSVRIDPEFQRDAMHKLRAIDKDIEQGTLWGV
jgi:hypothetical protein